MPHPVKPNPKAGRLSKALVTAGETLIEVVEVRITIVAGVTRPLVVQLHAVLIQRLKEKRTAKVVVILDSHIEGMKEGAIEVEAEVEVRGEEVVLNPVIMTGDKGGMVLIVLSVCDNFNKFEF